MPKYSQVVALVQLELLGQVMRDRLHLQVHSHQYQEVAFKRKIRP